MKALMNLFRVNMPGFFLIFFFFNGNAADSKKLLINEILAVNGSGLKDADGECSDWIEIFNPGTEAIDLTGWALTDNPENTGTWIFPSMILPGGNYLVVFASDKNRSDPSGELHTNFRLSGSGEYLALMEPDLKTISYSYGGSFPVQQSDISYGIYRELLVFFNQPTPGEANNPGNQVLAPVFSHQPGFYDAPFSVELTSPQNGLPVYYTTDGTQPDPKTALLYTGPVEIKTTTPLSAAVFDQIANHSSIVTHTYLFAADIIRQPANPAGYPSEWSPYAFSAGNAPADYEMDPEICNHPDYKDVICDALKSIPSISLVTNPGYIFSHETDPLTGGIYIYTGDTSKGNLGEDWERPVSVEYIDPPGKTSFQINCGLRLHGGNSRKPENSQKHSFRLSFRNDYGPSKLNYDLFDYGGATNTFNALVLRSGYNYSWIKNNATQRKRADYLRDPFAKNTQLDMGHPSAHNQFVHLYINGLYWGVYNVSEKITDDFMESYLGGRETDWDVVKDHSEIVDGNRDAWNRLINQANTGFSTLAAYRKVQGENADGSAGSPYENLLDVDNLIDYMIYNMYIGNNDWDHNNWITARNRVEALGGFRFFCWDAEDALLDVNVNMTGENNNGNPSMIYTKLRQNEEFKLQFADHLQKHFFNGGALTPEKTASRYSVLAEEIDQAIICESARWGDYRKDVMPSDADRLVYTRNIHWLPEVEGKLKDYFPYRSALVLNQFKSAGLFPALDAPVFSHNGGIIESTVDLVISARAGDIYFTIDGTDPRASGGTVATASARLYAKPLKIEGTGVIKARAKQGNVWSAITEAAFSSNSSGGIFVSAPHLPLISVVQAYPNPFNAYTRIEFRIQKPCLVKAAIYDSDGRLVKYLFNGNQVPGIHGLTWIASGQSVGVYYYRIQLDQTFYSGKLILIK